MSRESDRNTSKSPRRDFLIKLRGIPYTSTKDDIKTFLYPCRIVNVHLFSDNGSSSGECLVSLESEIDVRDALKKDKEYLGKRYIEVFRATNYEYNFFVKHKGMVSWREPVTHIHGLPCTCTMADIQTFFNDIEIATNGIYISRDMSDNASGGGFVAFVNMENGYKAIDIYDQKRMQHSTITLSPSTYDEAKKTILNDAHLNGKRFADEEEDTKITNEKKNIRSRSRQRSRSKSRRDNRDRTAPRRRLPSVSPRPRSRPQMKTINQKFRDRRSRSRSPVHHSSPTPNRNGEYRVKMCGMPFTIIEKDISQFFPSTCRPVRIEIMYDRRTKRPNGDGHAYFKTLNKAKEALKCDRKYMGNRYVELYLDSSSNHGKTKNADSRRQSSRSPSKPQNNEHDDDGSRSRSKSPH